MTAWAISFAAGIFDSHAKQTIVRLYIAWNEMDSEERATEQDELFDAIRTYNRKAEGIYKIQLWGLLIGAVLYFMGHGIQIYGNSRLPGPATSEASP